MPSAERMICCCIARSSDLNWGWRGDWPRERIVHVQLGAQKTIRGTAALKSTLFYCIKALSATDAKKASLRSGVNRRALSLP